MNYLFNTVVTMKDYNRGKWYIEPDIIKPQYIEAASVQDALQVYRENVGESPVGVEISNTAIKNREPIYRDRGEEAVQVGFMITGKTYMQDERYKWTTQYIELWVDIVTIVDTVF